MISDAINRAFIRAYVAVKREEGQTFVEYSMIGVLIAVALVATLGFFKGDLITALNSIRGSLK
jgi:Flp pilus assembly pilin Flp